MNRKRLKLDKCFFVAWLGVAIMFLGVSSASAIPLENWQVTSSNAQHLQSPGIAGHTHVYTEYMFNADYFDQAVDAFCVEDVVTNPKSQYRLVGFDEYVASYGTDWYNSWYNKYYLAAVIASNYFYNNTTLQWTKAATQIAIWNNLFGVLVSNNTQIGQTLNADANEIKIAAANLSIAGPISVAQGHNTNSQDYLVPVAVPEPTAILLLGLGIISLVCIRKKIVKC